MSVITNKGAGNTPNAPDTQTMISAQNNANLLSAQEQQAINQTDQITPYGSLTYQHPDPSDPGATVAVQNLTPAEQANLSYSNQAQNAMGSNVNALLASNSGLLSNGYDVNGGVNALQYGTDNPSGGASEQALQNSIMAQLNPQLQQESAALQTSLRNQGLAPGSDAWNNAMRQQAQNQTSAQLQAVQAGDNLYFQNAGLNNSAIGQAQSMYDTGQNQLLGVAGNILGGAYVQSPNLVNTPTESVAPTNALGAYATNYQDALNTHNTNYAQNQALINYGTNTISQFGGAAMGAMA
jgi:hypothetical protein